MTRVPYVRMRNGSSVTVWWRDWSNPPDRGAGPISAYVVYYRRGGDADWEALQQTRSKMAAVTGLRRDTNYEFRVAAVHQSGVVGIASPLLDVSTCGSMFVESYHIISYHMLYYDIRHLTHFSKHPFWVFSTHLFFWFIFIIFIVISPCCLCIHVKCKCFQSVGLVHKRLVDCIKSYDTIVQCGSFQRNVEKWWWWW